MQGNRIKKILCLFVAMQCIVCSFVFAEWRDRYGPPQDIALSELIEHPNLWLDVPVKIHVRFSRFCDVYNPFFTQFTNDLYMNFFAWDVQTHIWNKNGFSEEYPYFYVRKDNRELKTFLKLRAFDTISIYGKVTGVFDNKPHFQVVWVCRLPGDLNIYNLKLLNKGMKAFDKKEFDKALPLFDQFLKTNPPVDLKSMIYKTKIKILMFERNDFTGAQMALDEAMAIAPRDAELNTLNYLVQQYTMHAGVLPIPEDIFADENAVPKQKGGNKEIGEGVKDDAVDDDAADDDAADDDAADDDAAEDDAVDDDAVDDDAVDDDAVDDDAVDDDAVDDDAVDDDAVDDDAVDDDAVDDDM